jgi:hypothetical protein
MHDFSPPLSFAQSGFRLLVIMGTALLVASGCATAPGSRNSSAAAPGSGISSNAPAPLTSASSVKPVEARSANEISLFDGKTLTGWAVTDFAGHGEVRVDDGKLILDSGVMTGVNWTNDLPRMNYEISLEAMRVDGNDFFCGLTFPVGDDPCSLIVGGWGGGVVGLSSLDGQDAANNDTTKYMNFDNGRWFKIRLRVTPNKIESWIDGEQIVDADTKGRKISIRVEVEPSKPLGFATWSTTGALRNIKLRRL